MDLHALTLEIINGKRLHASDDLSFLIHHNLQELCDEADLLRKHFNGDHIDLCTIINGRSGRCPEDCKYCAQSAYHKTSCEIYDFLDEEQIMEAAHANEEAGVHRFSIVTSGRKLDGAEFEKALSAYKRISAECDLSLCASHGFLTSEQFHELKKAGVNRYHCNIETSADYFSSICTTHTFEQKIDNIRRAMDAGLSVCSGGIIGMGESWEDRISMALTLAELNVDSVPLNALMPIPGTPLQDIQRISQDDILRTVAIFRFIHPEANIRIAAGRAIMADNGASLFCSGASATITGNMLTTTASTIQKDKNMFLNLGRDINK